MQFQVTVRRAVYEYVEEIVEADSEFEAGEIAAERVEDEFIEHSFGEVWVEAVNVERINSE